MSHAYSAENNPYNFQNVQEIYSKIKIFLPKESVREPYAMLDALLQIMWIICRSELSGVLAKLDYIIEMVEREKGQTI